MNVESVGGWGVFRVERVDVELRNGVGGVYEGMGGRKGEGVMIVGIVEDEVMVMGE